MKLKQLTELVKNWRWFIKLYYRFYKEIWMYQTLPLIIFQMGKVGSTSIMSAIPRTSYPLVYHAHVINRRRLRESITAWENGSPLNYQLIQTGYFTYFNIIRPKRPCKIITMTRDPIAYNISAFFQNYYRHTGQKFENTTLTVDEMITFFLKTNQEFPLEWFDVEVKGGLGLDIYQYSFPKDLGYLRIQQNNIDLLVYKSELSPDEQTNIVGEFLELPEFKITLRHVSADLVYSDVYMAVKEQIRFEPAFVDKMLDSKYVRHFYTDAEREQMRAKWLRIK